MKFRRRPRESTGWRVGLTRSPRVADDSGTSEHCLGQRRRTSDWLGNSISGGRPCCSAGPLTSTPDPRWEGGLIARRVPIYILQSVLKVHQQFFWVHYWWDRSVRREVRKVGPRSRCETKHKLKASFIKLKANRAKCFSW